MSAGEQLAEEQLREALGPVIDQMNAANERAQGYEDEARQVVEKAKKEAADIRAKADAERETARRIEKMIRAGRVAGIDGIEVPEGGSNGKGAGKLPPTSEKTKQRVWEAIERNFEIGDEMTRAQVEEVSGVHLTTATNCIEHFRAEKKMKKTRRRVPTGQRGRKAQHYARVV
jgi:hypothetical protein